MYAGLSPYDALALYAVIAYMDSVAGVFFPAGGMHAVPEAMAAAAEKHGVEIRYSTEVTRVEHAAGRAVAVHTAAGERIAADVVVLNPDLPVAYRELLGFEPRRLQRLSYSPSCYLLLAGSTRAYDAGAHHTISFGHAWRGGVRRAAVGPADERPVDARHEPDPVGLLARARRAAHLLRAVPDAEPRRADRLGAGRPACTASTCCATLDARGWEGFGDGIEVERVTTPADWADRGMERGAPFAAAHSFRQTGPVPARATCGARTSSSPARGRSRASACRWCWCRAGWPPSACSGATARTAPGRGDDDDRTPGRACADDHVAVREDGPP